MVLGLESLHSKRILHRDIKPANVSKNDEFCTENEEFCI